LPPGATNLPPTAATATNPASSSSNAPQMLETPAPGPKLSANTNISEQLLVIANENARYTFTSYGGGLKEIELLRYPETVSTRREKEPVTNRVATLNEFNLAPTLALLDREAVQGDGIFELTQMTNGVRAEK